MIIHTEKKGKFNPLNNSIPHSIPSSKEAEERIWKFVLGEVKMRWRVNYLERDRIIKEKVRYHSWVFITI